MHYITSNNHHLHPITSPIAIIAENLFLIDCPVARASEKQQRLFVCLLFNLRVCFCCQRTFGTTVEAA
jgi:hypothetical protein